MIPFDAIFRFRQRLLTLRDAPARGLRRLPFWAIPFSLVLVSCASTPPVTKSTPAPEHIVVGAGTSDDRTVIEKTNDQILQAQRTTVGEPVEPSGPVVNQDVP